MVRTAPLALNHWERPVCDSEPLLIRNDLLNLELLCGFLEHVDETKSSLNLLSATRSSAAESRTRADG